MNNFRGESTIPSEKPVTKRYNMTVQLLGQSGNVIRHPRSFAYMFTNIGDTICRVNQMVIFPNATPATALGDSRTVSAHEDEEFVGIINVSFNVGGAAPQIELVQLYYVD